MTRTWKSRGSTSSTRTGQLRKLRPDLLATLTKVAQQKWARVAVMPILETGASDSRFLRAAGIPSYGATGVFIDLDDNRNHGRDERIRKRDFYGGLDFYDEFVKALAGAPSKR